LEDNPSLGCILNFFFFRILKWSGRKILNTFYSFETINTHLVPTAGPFIITANHSSFMDTPVLQIACPRRITFLMTEKYYRLIWGRWFFKLMRAIPVRENTSYNIAPIKAALEVLRDNNVIGIFPEGGISKTGIIQDGRPGTLLLAQKAHVDVLPVYISGTYRALPRHAKFFRKSKIKVIFGPPTTFDELSKNIKGRNGLEVATKNLLHKISELSEKV
jgi:1-acyl-sn-glycerol-3-phosphate acyltransferase